MTCRYQHIIASSLNNAAFFLIFLILTQWRQKAYLVNLIYRGDVTGFNLYFLVCFTYIYMCVNMIPAKERMFSLGQTFADEISHLRRRQCHYISYVCMYSKINYHDCAILTVCTLRVDIILSPFPPRTVLLPI